MALRACWFLFTLFSTRLEIILVPNMAYRQRFVTVVDLVYRPLLSNNVVDSSKTAKPQLSSKQFHVQWQLIVAMLM